VFAATVANLVYDLGSRSADRAFKAYIAYPTDYNRNVLRGRLKRQDDHAHLVELEAQFLEGTDPITLKVTEVLKDGFLAELEDRINSRYQA